MDISSDEEAVDTRKEKKTLTRDSSKCIKCNVFLRKTTGYPLEIKTQEQAADLSRYPGFYAVVGDKICTKCRNVLRAVKSTIQRRSSAAVTQKMAAPSVPGTSRDPSTLVQMVPSSNSLLDYSLNNDTGNNYNCLR